MKVSESKLKRILRSENFRKSFDWIDHLFWLTFSLRLLSRDQQKEASLSIITTLETTLLQAFKNGMSIKQVHSRVPGVISKQMNITEAEFHRQLASSSTTETLDQLALRIAGQLTPAERERALRDI